MKSFFVINLLIALACASCWVMNLVKLTRCDFEAPWKGEIIHVVGLAGPASLVTVWFDDK